MLRNTVACVGYLFMSFYLRALASDSAGQLDVFGHDGDALGVDGAEVGVFEETHQVRLGGLLKCEDSRALEAEIRLEVLGNLSHKALERQLADEQLSGLLVASDLTQSDISRTISVGLLHPSSGWGGFTRCLGGELLAGRFASSGLSCCLLSTGHSNFWAAND